MTQNRLAVLVSVPVLALAAAVAVPATARADVGDILVQQTGASGQNVSDQDYVVANLAASQTIDDQVSSDAVTATVTNETLQPITVGLSDPSDATVQPGQSLTLRVEICVSAGFCMLILDAPPGV